MFQSSEWNNTMSDTGLGRLHHCGISVSDASMMYSRTGQKGYIPLLKSRSGKIALTALRVYQKTRKAIKQL
jgi:hypothetical protein